MSTSFITYLIGHYLGDFVFQPRWMGKGKSDSLKILALHVLTYSVVTLIVIELPIIIGYLFGYYDSMYTFYESICILFWLYIGHFSVDIWTSKLTSRAYKKYLKTNDPNDMQPFWLTLGLDQTLHGIHLYLIFLYYGTL